MKLGIPYALNEVGGRSNQEDSIFPLKGEADASTRLFMVCDGMGGHENGEVASGLVCSTFGARLANIDHEAFTVDMFNDALSAAYDALDREDPNPESQRKMGTTMTFLHLNDREVVVAHMGDSRVYHVRPSEHEPILYQSSDHSLVNELVRAEIITPEEALTHPRRNVITRAMQPRLESRHKADVRVFGDVKAGDYFFLCSDGVLESVSNDALVEILRRNVSDAEKIEAIRVMCQASSRDNFSAYLVPIVEGLPIVESPVVAAELVDDVDADTHQRDDWDANVTRPAPHFSDKELNSKGRTHFTPMNIGLACVALVAVTAAIWFAMSNIEFTSTKTVYNSHPRNGKSLSNDDVKKEGDKSDDAILDKVSEIGGVDSLKLEDGPVFSEDDEGINEKVDSLNTNNGPVSGSEHTNLGKVQQTIIKADAAGLDSTNTESDAKENLNAGDDDEALEDARGDRSKTI